MRAGTRDAGEVQRAIEKIAETNTLQCLVPRGPVRPKPLWALEQDEKSVIINALNKFSLDNIKSFIEKFAAKKLIKSDSVTIGYDKREIDRKNGKINEQDDEELADLNSIFFFSFFVVCSIR